MLAVAAQGTSATPHEIVAAVAVAVETLVLPALEVDLRWTSQLIRPADDLEHGPPPATREGRDWADLGRRAGEAESIWLEGHLPSPATVPPDPHRQPIHLLVRFPPARPGEVTAAVSIQEWALQRTGPAAVATAAAEWLLSASGELGLACGYVALDYADAWDPGSSWELAVAASPSDRDFRRRIWGYGWGTLLSADHAALVGGPERLTRVPGADLTRGPGGQVWIQLGPDPAAVTAEQISELRQVLEPVLPEGPRTLEEYRAPRTNRYRIPGPPYLL